MQGLAEMQDGGTHEVSRRSEGLRGGSLLERAAALLQRCTTRNERLQVCETVSLGGRRSVVLLECDGQRFLAGLSAQGVETMVALDGGVPWGEQR